MALNSSELGTKGLRRHLKFGSILAVLLAFVTWSAWRSGLESQPAGDISTRTSRLLMGTVWNIEIVHEGRLDAARRATDAAFRELERIDRLMSEWKPESPVSQINKDAGKWVEVPKELVSLIQRGIAYGEASSGAFDITWRGMGRLWRFDEEFRVPTQEEVSRAKSRVDFRAIEIDGTKVRLRNRDMAIGLGGIAKGYAIDRAAKVLSASGFSNYLVDGGGDIRVSGSRAGRPWQLGIQDPRGEHGVVIGRVKLTEGALVTSGDYERSRIVNGVRYHHIIDPRTGWPASECRSVSVIAESAEQADALATAIFVLGPSEGLDLAKKQGVETLIINARGGQHATDGFQRVLELQ